MKILETKNYWQKSISNKVLGENAANYLRLFKTILVFKLDITYDLGNILSKLIRKDDVVFDIGANIGQSACRYSKLVGSTGKVFSFEPVNANLQLLKKMKSILRLKNVTTFNVGIGEKSGIACIYIPIMKNSNIVVGTRASLRYSDNEYKDTIFKRENVKLKR